MGTHTMPLKAAVEYAPGGDIGLNDYPIFDEAHRGILNQKILDRYWNQEIGQETVSMFRLALRRKMNEIMPYYNQLYLSEQIKYDPLRTVDIKNFTQTESESTSTGDSETSSESDAKSRAVSQVFPQVALSGNGDYANGAQDNISDTAASGKSSEETSTKQDGTVNGEVSGFQGNAALMLMQYRQSFLNVDLEIIEQLQPLFMLIWDNGDEYTESRMNYGLGYLTF